ncbi:TetR/AcrR family transcriptional regulator [Vagococcus sp.]|uniref:TetR/AcrR family transcriptional regulator n=1 Tax=Vagococcus sp. TaxID=1933889 RepID=UPI003F9AA102
MGKIDPRVVKTRKKLRQAFLELLMSRTLGEMNIKDLTNQAGVTRGTFYLHYKDKETFIETIMEEIIEDFFTDVVEYTAVSGSDGRQVPYIVLDKVFENIGNSPEFFITLLKESDAEDYRILFSDKLYDYLLEHTSFNNPNPVRKLPKELLTNYLVYSLLGIAESWVSEGKIYANHYMASIFSKLMKSELFAEVGLNSFFIDMAGQSKIASVN